MSAAAYTPDEPPETNRQLSIEQRARSVPYKRPFTVAILTTVVFYLGLLALLTGVITFLLVPEELKREVAYSLVTLIPLCALFWVVSYFKRRKANCPLCRCTPFLDNLASKHQKAFRIRPLNYGTTAVLNAVLTQRWRCMYCGTPFDLLKSKKGTEYTADQEDP
jgi:hypothetical protein